MEKFSDFFKIKNINLLPNIQIYMTQKTAFHVILWFGQ